MLLEHRPVTCLAWSESSDCRPCVLSTEGPRVRGLTAAPIVIGGRRVDLVRRTAPWSVAVGQELVGSRLVMHQRVEVVRAKVMGRRRSWQRTVLRAYRRRLTDVPFRQLWPSGRRMTRRWVGRGGCRDNWRRLRRLRVPGHGQATPAAAALFTLALVAPSYLAFAQGHAVHLEQEAEPNVRFEREISWPSSPLSRGVDHAVVEQRLGEVAVREADAGSLKSYSDRRLEKEVLRISSWILDPAIRYQ